MYIKRTIQDELAILSKEYPVLVLTGPRQSGKTTLAKSIFSDKPYITLENPAERKLFKTDPQGFLNRFPDGAIFDEVQNTPELFSYLQGIVDEDGRVGLFVLTGSQQIGLLEKVTQSLAGRAGIVELLPFSYEEKSQLLQTDGNWQDLALRGAYPPVHVRGMRSDRWHKNYITTYLQRDMRQVVNIKDFATFNTFLKLCATLTGQQLNIESLASACKVDMKTVRSWLRVLEACYLIYFLHPYYKNFQKRLTKAPKLYFFDTGLASSLLGVKDLSRAEDLPLKGRLFENFVFTELLKFIRHRGLDGALYYWRDSNGVEVDFILDLEGRTFAIEAKAGITPKVDFTKIVSKWVKWANLPESQAKVIYGGSEKLSNKGIDYMPWNTIHKILET